MPAVAAATRHRVAGEHRELDREAERAAGRDRVADHERGLPDDERRLVGQPGDGRLVGPARRRRASPATLTPMSAERGRRHPLDLGPGVGVAAELGDEPDEDDRPGRRS